MAFAQLLSLAEQVVAKTQRELPTEIRALAMQLPVTYQDWPTDAVLGDRFDPDILGLFVGDHHGIDTGTGNTVPPTVILFLENILDEADHDLEIFKDEVRDTYLHELGHYLGWDENDLEARGL